MSTSIIQGLNYPFAPELRLVFNINNNKINLSCMLLINALLEKHALTVSRLLFIQEHVGPSNTRTLEH